MYRPLVRENLSLTLANADAWTAEKNEALMVEIDTDKNGQVSEAEFLKYFRFQWGGGLDRVTQEEFQLVIDLFTETATRAQAGVLGVELDEGLPSSPATQDNADLSEEENDPFGGCRSGEEELPNMSPARI